MSDPQKQGLHKIQDDHLRGYSGFFTLRKIHRLRQDCQPEVSIEQWGGGAIGAIPVVCPISY